MLWAMNRKQTLDVSFLLEYLGGCGSGIQDLFHSMLFLIFGIQRSSGTSEQKMICIFSEIEISYHLKRFPHSSFGIPKIVFHVKSLMSLGHFFIRIPWRWISIRRKNVRIIVPRVLRRIKNLSCLCTRQTFFPRIDGFYMINFGYNAILG